MFTVALSGAIGVCLSLILAIPAVVVEWRHKRHSDHPLLVDIDFWRGKRLTDRESFLLGLLIHLLMGLAFGLLYPFYASLVSGLWPYPTPYDALSLSSFLGDLFILQNVIVLPLLGAGFFGRREARFIWLETLVTLALFALGYGLIIAWFGSAWFS